MCAAASTGLADRTPMTPRSCEFIVVGRRGIDVSLQLWTVIRVRYCYAMIDRSKCLEVESNPDVVSGA